MSNECNHSSWLAPNWVDGVVVVVVVVVWPHIVAFLDTTIVPYIFDCIWNHLRVPLLANLPLLKDDDTQDPTGADSSQTTSETTRRLLKEETPLLTTLVA